MLRFHKEFKALRFPFVFNGLRSVIITSLTLLILAAMLLINVVMAIFAQRDLVNERIRQGRLMLLAAESLLMENQEHGAKPWWVFANTPRFRISLNKMVHSSDFSSFLLFKANGKMVFSTGVWTEMEKKMAGDSLESDTDLVFLGKTWGWLWPAPEKVILKSALMDRSKRTGSAAALCDLKPLYGQLRNSQPIILAYIALNVFILVLFGIGLLSFTIVRPIHRILQVTEKFDGHFPSPDSDVLVENEIGRLSKSLNLMLRRLHANEKRLQENISSLEEANQEIKKTQNEMIKSEKMASIGRLATGIAHEIGNPLGIILGYVELLERKDLNHDERTDFLKRLESEVRRIHRIIRDLLDFSRPSVHDQENARVHELLDEVLTVLSPQSVFEEIEIIPHYNAKNQTVGIAPDSLKQIFLNVILNAADAINEVSGERSTGTTKTISITTRNREDFLIVDFLDNGCGISAGNVARVFDPFFTTKDPGQGTGLGLSICYTIMDRAGGSIHVDSKAGEGTKVTLEIPLEPV
jgi:two-component system NtrC family sensor kinase